MKKMFLRLTAALGLAAMGTSCTTTYDAYGRPVQSVDPAAAALGIAAAGVIGYALADGDRHRRSHGYSGHSGHYAHGYASHRSHRNVCR